MKKVIIGCLSILCLMSCHKKEPEDFTTFTAADGCKFPISYKPCYEFSEEVETKGKYIDSSAYLNQVVGTWKLFCTKIPVYHGPTGNPACSYTYIPTDSVKMITLIFKPDFTFVYNSLDSSKIAFGNINPYEGQLKWSDNQFYYTKNIPFYYFHLGFFKILENKLIINFAWSGNFYFKKVQ